MFQAYQPQEELSLEPQSIVLERPTTVLWWILGFTLLFLVKYPIKHRRR